MIYVQSKLEKLGAEKFEVQVMSFLNKAVLIGYLGVYPEIEKIRGGISLCTLKLYTYQEWRDSNTKRLCRSYDWHVIQAFGKLGDAAHEYLKQGSQIYVEGALYTYHWDIGARLYESYPVLIASSIKFLDGDSEQEYFGLGSLRPPPTRPYSSLPDVKSSIANQYLIAPLESKANLIRLFSGGREPINGEEVHFLKVTRGEASPSSTKEKIWLSLWNIWRQKFKAKHPTHTPQDECEDCGCIIPKERLEAVPNTTRCVNCQTKYELMTDPRVKSAPGWHGLHRPTSSYKDQDEDT